MYYVDGLFQLCCLQLSQNAVADYNRARLYLADLANRDGVPVLSDISEAVNCVIQRLRDFSSDWKITLCQGCDTSNYRTTKYHTVLVTYNLNFLVWAKTGDISLPECLQLMVLLSALCFVVIKLIKVLCVGIITHPKLLIAGDVIRLTQIVVA